MEGVFLITKFHLLAYRLIIGIAFLSVPFLYSEGPSQVNQLHSSQYEFEIDESLTDHSADPVKAVLVSEVNSFKVGQPFWVAINLSMDDHWHVYWKNPGDSGMPVSVEWKLPEGFKADAPEWSYPQRIDNEGFVGFGYEKAVTFLVRITPPQSLSKADKYPLKATIKYLVCSDSACLPGENTVDLTLSSNVEQPTVNAAQAEMFAKARDLLPKTAWNFKAQRMNDLIQLAVESPTPLSGKMVSGYFCPEKGQSIDYHKSLAISEGENGSYSIALKETDDLSKSNALKGVLVLTTQKDGQPSVYALDINTPVLDRSGNGEQLLVANDSKKPSVKIDYPIENEGYEGGFGLAMVMAFIGGMILNLMPCVLPVISFKILSFVKMARQSRAVTMQHGLSFGLGVMISFWTLAGALLILQAYGHAVGWGFQLQEPIFVGILAAVLFIFSLSLFGLFELGTKMGSMAGQMQSHGKEGLKASFLSGVLATVIATPCTGPFLGTAIGFAMTLPYYLSLMIFTSLGLGMAFPYLLLSAFPELMRFLPKPGNWMVVFKQLMGFLMLASVLWLVWVFGAQTNSMAIVILLGSFFLMSLACWIYGQWGTPVHSKKSRWISMVVSSVLLLGGFYILTFAAQGTSSVEVSSTKIAANDEVWEEFSPERVAELRAKGIPVFVDFTAKWCLICQVNHAVLTTDDVHAKFNEKGVVRMKADWTKKDAVITEELRKFGRNSVPLYVLYDGSEKPAILPQVLTSNVVMNHLEDVDQNIAMEDEPGRHRAPH